MPRVYKTILPRIRKSLRDRGLITTLRRSVLLPFHVVKEYRDAKKLRPGNYKSEFDRAYDVETDGEYDGWTYLSDLDIASPNWIDANDYHGIEPERFRMVLASLNIAFDNYTFVDFGSGKGRALLLASEFPFKEIIGLEFSSELHVIAEANMQRYRSATQKCKNIRSINMDFTAFDLPSGPAILFFFDPCKQRVLEEVVSRIEGALSSRSGPLFIAYVAPRSETLRIFDSSRFLKVVFRNPEFRFVIYEAVLAPA